MTDLFRSLQLTAGEALFGELRRSARLEDVAKGRQGAVLVSPQEQGTPIVRTTSRYASASQRFTPLHQRLATQVQEVSETSLPFNNGLFEVYSNAYAKMGFHSDQALDLDPASSIAILSCYAKPPPPGAERKLIVEPKAGGDPFAITMPDNSVIVFSVETNRHFKHKIVLDRSSNPPANEWLGLTFRTSKTFVRYGAEAAFADGTPLTIASEDEQRHFFKLRGQENREPSFQYPRLTYTVSPSDLLLPEMIRGPEAQA